MTPQGEKILHYRTGTDGLTYVWIPPGRVATGAGTDLTLDKGFWLGSTPVTQAAWKRVMGTALSHFQGDSLPMESITQSEAEEYCRKVDGRLPTDLEWEYAARAGTPGDRYGELDSIAWYEGNSGGETHPVGVKLPNAFGLYDMLGNVWERTRDSMRGGSWFNNPRYVRVSYRYRLEPTVRSNDLGVRCAGDWAAPTTSGTDEKRPIAQ